MIITTKYHKKVIETEVKHFNILFLISSSGVCFTNIIEFIHCQLNFTFYSIHNWLLVRAIAKPEKNKKGYEIGNVVLAFDMYYVDKLKTPYT